MPRGSFLPVLVELSLPPPGSLSMSNSLFTNVVFTRLPKTENKNPIKILSRFQNYIAGKLKAQRTVTRKIKMEIIEKPFKRFEEIQMLGGMVVNDRYAILLFFLIDLPNRVTRNRCPTPSISRTRTDMKIG